MNFNNVSIVLAIVLSFQFSHRTQFMFVAEHWRGKRNHRVKFMYFSNPLLSLFSCIHVSNKIFRWRDIAVRATAAQSQISFTLKNTKNVHGIRCRLKVFPSHFLFLGLLINFAAFFCLHWEICPRTQNQQKQTKHFLTGWRKAADIWMRLPTMRLPQGQWKSKQNIVRGHASASTVRFFSLAEVK